MKPGAVLVDVAIDQGGCFETSHATTHDDPVFEVDGIVHYCVANMPGAVPVTSTKALTNVTLPYVEAIADKGVARAIADDPALAKGVNVDRRAQITYEAVAEAHGLDRTRRSADASPVLAAAEVLEGCARVGVCRSASAAASLLLRALGRRDLDDRAT